MLKINRLQIKIITNQGDYGIDKQFFEGLNFLASDDNTCGKSSIIEAIYYSLGFEEIIGGRGEKVLTSAYKTFIEDNDQILNVIGSKIYLEISNGLEVVTLHRTAKDRIRDSKLITVYYSSLDMINDSKTLVEDMYVHMKNSAMNIKGFHAFLEKFLHLKLPVVPATDGKQRKLYLQLIFSCMFIEQKHGWGDIFSGIPLLGIKDSKKRVIEYVLNLDTINTEKKKEEIKFEEIRIRNEWKAEIEELKNAVNKETCSVSGVPIEPCEFSRITANGVHIFKDKKYIDSFIKDLKKNYKKLQLVRPKVVDNFDELQIELEETESDIEKFEQEICDLRSQLSKENSAIVILNENIENIEIDLQNNKDAAKLRELGSTIGCKSFKDVCPVCNQTIADSLLPVIEENEIMSIDENIRHLEAQREMLSYARESHYGNKKNIDKKLQVFQGKVFSLRRLAMALRNDIYAINDSVSESIVYKKIELLNEIDRLEVLKKFVADKIDNLVQLGNDWGKMLENKKKIPKKKFSTLDYEKQEKLRRHFIDNLQKYGYKSVINMESIQISEENYLPIIEEFDMKFDSSASDNIRAIWAYTIALMQTSMEKKGNHPGVIIFDEPNQHSIIPEDMEEFFKSLLNFGKTSQIIVGITVKDTDTKLEIQKLPKELYHIIQVKNKAFQKIDRLY